MILIRFPGNGCKHPAGEPRSTPHAFPDHRQQAHVFVHLNGFQIAVCEFDRQIGRQYF